MQELFKKLEFEKISNYRLSDDTSEWNKEIMSYLHGEYPELAHLPIKINYNVKDEKSSTLVGSIAVGKKSLITIPLIINQGLLSPLDVCIYENNIIPLNSNIIQIITGNKSAFSQLIKEEETDTVKKLFRKDLYEIDTLGKYGEFSMLDHISHTITKEAKEKFLERCKDLKNFYKTSSFFEKLEKLEPSEKTLEFDWDLYMIEKRAERDYRLYLGNSEYDVEKIIDNIPEEALVKIKEGMDKKAKVSNKEKEIDYLEKVGEAPLCDFNGEALDIKIEFDKTGNWKLDNKIQKEASGLENLKSSELKTGNFGSFVIDGKLSKPVFLEKVSYLNDEILIDAFDGINMTKIAFNKGIRNIVADNDTFYFPENIAFVKLGNVKNDFLEIKGHRGKNSILRIDEDNFNFSGPDIKKYAELGHNVENLNLTDAKWTMIKLGVDREEINNISLGIGNKYFFNSKILVPKEPILIKESEILPDIDFTKEAAELNNGATVDGLLSLNFLNKDNINYFTQSLSFYEQILSNLSQLLIAVRLGLSIIPEGALKRAIESLSTVAIKLYELAALHKSIK